MERSIFIFVVLLAIAAAAGYVVYTQPELIESVTRRDADRDTASSAPPQRVAEAPLPSFDIVRVDPAGTTVIAGRALPGAQVAILSNGKEVGRVTANERGDWVIYIETPLQEGTQELTLLMYGANGALTKGTETVVVAVPARPGDKPLVVLSDAAGASRVLQSPSPDAGMVLTLEAIDYDDKGRITFSGRGDVGSVVRLYVDDQPIGDAVVDDKGRWTLNPVDQIVAGVRRLRIDQLASEGTVSARVELPFERAAPEGLVMAGGKIVVQPGNSLWRISRKLYGTGFQYTVIYEANKDQIRDPDLIYPGQIFAVPGEPGS
ncbi:MAG: LysM peptidoglycan-binding domain-containing protein [Alphaproteobacteria bacterium]|nr:LysM peptidoglycan-binding domain-containing protein [Alphaproteobacteria bacterium]